MKDHTYARWVETNTLYGISRYSFVCITEPMEELEHPFPNAGFIIDHMKTIYFRMVSLALAQRAMVLTFSERANITSSKICDKKMWKKAIEDIEELTQDYSLFTNSIFHNEITTQEQGIELYDMLHHHLKIDHTVKELEKEIEGLHNNSSLIESRNTNSSIEKLTIIGALFILPNLILAFTSNFWFTDKNATLGWAPWNWFTGIKNLVVHPQLFIMLSIILLAMGLSWMLIRQKSKASKWVIIISIIAIIIPFFAFFPVMISWEWIVVFVVISLFPILFVIFKSTFPKQKRHV